MITCHHQQIAVVSFFAVLTRVITITVVRYTLFNLPINLHFYALTYLEVVPEAEWQIAAAFVYGVVARHCSTLLRQTDNMVVFYTLHACNFYTVPHLVTNYILSNNV